MASIGDFFGGSDSKEPFLGIYVSTDAIYIAEAAAGGGRIDVKQLVRVPVPAKPETGTTTRLGTLNTEFLADTARLLELLKPALEQGKWSAKRAVVTLAPQFGLARFFVMPAVDRRFWKQSVPLEAKKYIPFPFNDLSFDFQVFPGLSGDKRRMSVLFALMPQKNVDSIRTIMQGLGLEIASVELVSFSAPRGWMAASGGASNAVIAQVHLDPQSAYLVMHYNGVPYITREVHWTGDQFDRRRLDLGGSIDFARKQLGVKDLKLVVSGSVDLVSLRDGLKEDTNIETGVSALSEAGLPTTEWPVLSAVGASLRSSRGLQTVSLDVSQTSRKQTEDLRVVRTLTIVVGTLVACLLVGAIFNEISVFSALSTLAALKRKTRSAGAIATMPSDQVDDYVAQVQKEVRAYGTVLAQPVLTVKWWSLLPDAIPDNVWLTGLNYTTKIADSGQESRVLELQGYSYAQDKNADVQSAKQFLENIRQNKEFLHTFPECLPSFEGGGSDADAPEKRTPFSVTCKPKLPMRG